MPNGMKYAIIIPHKISIDKRGKRGAMKIYGIEKYSLVDYDGYVACTLFTGGCNLRCPFCHNASLVTGVGAKALDEEEIFAYLRMRKGLVDAVCVTGGEPTLHRDLPELLVRIRALGYRIKLDTNGTKPDVLAALLEAGLVDYVAMDVKNAPSAYPKTAGVEVDIAAIERSIALLKEGKVDYEFRTTVVAGYHTPQEIGQIAAWIAGAKRYFLQPFADHGTNLTPGLSGVSEEMLGEMQRQAQAYVPTKIRSL